ncbi:hypothetical protein RJ639_005371 [Escallonia herrerae]|uniref:Reverse transcriptase/retrotransposon-derived protein RNase H-like domain-containing protein n=1 Tax=Escallonia herrerae TaxID=1293975 RepID=A0AA89AVU9_9ASTE|nr:hypothetical protein RJ639_005371 [Escallonia herrerae]
MKLIPPETLTSILGATERSVTPMLESSLDECSQKTLISSQLPPISKCLHGREVSPGRRRFSVFTTGRGTWRAEDLRPSRGDNLGRTQAFASNPSQEKRKLAESRRSAPKDPPVINTISGGPSVEGLSSSSQKAYARQVNLTQGPTKWARTYADLEFDNSDLEGAVLPHDDALVITLPIDAFQVKRILVDTRSLADIIFKDAFLQMGISKDRVKPISSSLYGFTGASAPVKGITSLTVIAGETPRQTTHTLDFLIVKVKSSYNGILGRIAERCLLFFKALKNIKSFEWTVECQASFDALKEYLASPPLISKPITREELFLYLAVAKSAVSAILIREQDGRQLPIYYVSKVLQGAELRYPSAKNLRLLF